MLLRLAYLGVTNAFAMLRLLPMTDRDKDAEILALRHQITVLERQLGRGKIRFTPSDRASVQAVVTENATLKRRIRQLAQEHRALQERFEGCRANLRHAETRIGDLEAELTERAHEGRH